MPPQVKEVEIEVSVAGKDGKQFYEGAPTEQEVRTYMEAQGFVFKRKEASTLDQEFNLWFDNSRPDFELAD